MFNMMLAVAPRFAHFGPMLNPRSLRSVQRLGRAPPLACTSRLSRQHSLWPSRPVRPPPTLTPSISVQCSLYVSVQPNPQRQPYPAQSPLTLCVGTLTCAAVTRPVHKSTDGLRNALTGPTSCQLTSSLAARLQSEYIKMTASEHNQSAISTIRLRRPRR